MPVVCPLNDGQILIMGGLGRGLVGLNDVFLMQTADNSIERIFKGGPIKFFNGSNECAKFIGNAVVAFVKRSNQKAFMIEFSFSPNIIAIRKEF